MAYEGCALNLQSYGNHNEDFEIRLDLAIGICDEWNAQDPEVLPT